MRFFVCDTGPRWRVEAAAGMIRERAGADADIEAVTLDPPGPAPATSEAVDDVPRREYDIVVALSSAAAAACPVIPGNPSRVTWDLPDAVGTDSQEAIRQRLSLQIQTLFEQGYLDALLGAKESTDLILDSVSDGIVAHDGNRRIFYFNRAAEEITEYRRDDVLGRDCHDVFPGNLCGGKCLFCAPGAMPPGQSRRLEIATRSGGRRTVESTLNPMRRGPATPVGAYVLSFRDVTRELQLARRAGETERFSGIVGRDDTMLELFDLIGSLADSAVPVLIRGESGTGKELIAAAIHNEGPRANKLFVPVNCGALPESLLESELFGHVKGAFTGAIRDKKGRFELADGGTIFLDEIGDITLPMQVKLLRVLQEGTFERVGSEETRRVDVRIISATNKNLEKEIEEGRFREDLYYRLNVVPVYVPPLRERRADIPLLMDHVLAGALTKTGREGVVFSADARDIMMTYDWPGNVRELQNWVQFALVKCRDSVILPEHLPPPKPGFVRPAPSRRRKLDQESVRAALRKTGNNRVEAAKLLGVSRATLYRFLDECPDVS